MRRRKTNKYRNFKPVVGQAAAPPPSAQKAPAGSFIIAGSASRHWTLIRWGSTSAGMDIASSCGLSRRRMAIQLRAFSSRLCVSSCLQVFMSFFNFLSCLVDIPRQRNGGGGVR